MLYPLRQYPRLRPALTALLLTALLAALTGGLVAMPGRISLRPIPSAAPADAPARPLPTGTTSLGAALTPDPQTGGLRLLAQAVTGDLRVETDQPLTVAGDLRVGGALELHAPRLSIMADVAAARVDLRAAGLLDLAAGRTITARAGAVGGQIRLSADALVLAGVLDAAGSAGGSIALSGRQIIQAAPTVASGSVGAGGTVTIQTTGGYTATAAAALDVSGARAAGSLRIDAGGGRLFSSAPMRAGGPTGGSMLLLGHDIVLAAADLDARGAQAGGEVLVGRAGTPGAQPGTADVLISPSAQIRADATDAGDGGRIVVWADQATVARGRLSARGGSAGGDGGVVDVSGRASLASSATVRVDAPAGHAGRAIFDPKNLTISSAAGYPQFDLINPTPTAGDLFGYVTNVSSSGGAISGTVIPLSTGNVLVLDSGDDAVAVDAGAAYLFDGTTGALISALTGSKASDRVGSLDINGTSGALALGNGNVLVRSPLWDDGAAANAGAVTWISGTTGVSGAISASNSLVGSTKDDSIGGTTANEGVFALSSGNYVVLSPNWDGWGVTPAPVDAGAATWGSGTTGVSGAISAGNSLVGTHTSDHVGGSVTLLSNGNYVVISSSWDNAAVTNVGAVTWGSGTAGAKGAVSTGNSLIGTAAGDQVGLNGVIALTNGNYVALSSAWSNSGTINAGAVTWCSGSAATVAQVSPSNSLVGTHAGDKVGASAIALANGNYVARSPTWDNGLIADAGAVTWGSGSGGSSGAVAPANSIVGGTANDLVGGTAITELQNGNYVVLSPKWDNGAVADAGAATWASGGAASGLTISAANSLVGSSSGDIDSASTVTALSNGSYVVSMPSWNADAITGNVGAATWGSGSGGVTGVVSAANSLVGSTSGDDVGSGGVTPLANGHYVVVSPGWQSASTIIVGAATWGSASGGVTGVVSAANSLVGSTKSDHVGGGGVTALANGNYVVVSPDWNNGAITIAGAATWGSGSSGVKGVVSVTNSLVGSHTSDLVGGDGVLALPNGSYVVRSSSWSNGTAAGAGAVTWCSGSSAVAGEISADNSLVGSSANDSVGLDAVVELSSGNYVVLSSSWNNGAVTSAGAATWGSDSSGVKGVVSATNSLVGSHTDDQVGYALHALTGNDYLVSSPFWNNETMTQVGAVTLSRGAAGVSGVVSVQNSVAGQQAGSLVEAPLGSGPNSSFYVISAKHDRVAVGLADLRTLLPYSHGQASTTGLFTDSLTSLLSEGVALTIQANNDITIGSTLTVNNPAGIGGAIIAQAGRSLLINANINTDGAPLTLIANDRVVNGVVDSQRDAGQASIAVANGATINAGTADVTVDMRDGAGKANATPGGITLGQVTGNLVIIAGTLTPGGADVGTTTVIGGLNLGGGLNATVNGATPSLVDRIEVTGPVSLSGALLISVGASYIPKNGDRITLISNDGSDAVIGTFNGLPEGSTYTIGGMKMIISYKGGDGNDVTLRAGYSSFLPLIRR